MIDETETLQEHADDERGFLHRELHADAAALAIAERLERIRRTRGFGGAREILRIEDLRARAPSDRVAVQHRRQHHHLRPRFETVLAPEHLVAVGQHRERRRRRPHAERLFEHLLHVAQRVHLLHRRQHGRIGAEHGVDFFRGAREHVRVVEKEVGREREQPARRLVAGDQERDDLVADVLVVEALARLLVDALEHVIEQVVLAVAYGAGLGAPFGDDPVDDPVHERDVRLHLAPFRAQEDIFEREAALAHREFKRVDHRGDERVVVVAVERVEAVPEAAQADRVERERRHVAHDIDLVVGVHPLPLQHELLRHVEHHRMVAGHRACAKIRQQDVVRFRPVRLARVSGEESVAGEVAHLAQRAAHRFVEAPFVAELVHERLPPHDRERLAHHVEFEDGTHLAGDRHDILNRRRRAEIQHVADDRPLLGMGDGLEHAVRLQTAMPKACSSRSSSSGIMAATCSTFGNTFAPAISPKSRFSR